MAQAITLRPFSVTTLQVSALKSVNKYAIISASLAGLFILYFLLPHTGVFSVFFHLSVLYIVFLPLVAFALAIVALRQTAHTPNFNRMLSMIALAVTSLYFMVALAIPVVLIGLYLLYSYVI